MNWHVEKQPLKFNINTNKIGILHSMPITQKATPPANTINLKAVEQKKQFRHKRNLQIVTRYYYWYDVKRLRRDDALQKLSDEEFFLDTRTISGIIFQNVDFYKKLKLQQPAQKDLQHYQWV